MIARNARKLTVITARGSKLVAKHRFHFTKKRLDAAGPPSAGNRAYYYDDEVSGLCLAVSRAGKRSFLLYRKVLGRPERVAIGAYPTLSIEEARKKAKAMNWKIENGENPAEERRAIRGEMTLGELFAEYIEVHAKLHKKTWAEDIAQFNRYLHPWRLRSISSIRRIDVVRLHARVGNHARYAANRLVELVRSIYNWAKTEGGWKGENPAANIEPFKEPQRERFLQAEELPAFFGALAEDASEDTRDYVLLSLFTGQRQANVLGMRWDEISFERLLWQIPGAKTKNGKPIDVHLSQSAIDVLSARRAASEGVQWVFPGKGRTGHLVEPKKAWRRILKRAGITNLRLHDLRRTLGSWEAATNASLAIIGKSLGHLDPSTTTIYARLNLDPVRAAVDKATAAMLHAAGVGPGEPLEQNDK